MSAPPPPRLWRRPSKLFPMTSENVSSDFEPVPMINGEYIIRDPQLRFWTIRTLSSEVALNFNCKPQMNRWKLEGDYSITGEFTLKSIIANRYVSLFPIEYEDNQGNTEIEYMSVLTTKYDKAAKFKALATNRLDIVYLQTQNHFVSICEHSQKLKFHKQREIPWKFERVNS